MLCWIRPLINDVLGRKCSLRVKAAGDEGHALYAGLIQLLKNGVHDSGGKEDLPVGDWYLSAVDDGSVERFD